MDLCIRLWYLSVLLILFMVPNHVLKANPVPNYDEQDDMALYAREVEETTMIDFDRWTPEPLNVTDANFKPQPSPTENGMIDRWVERIRHWMNSSYGRVRSWGQSAKDKFCSYECFKQYARVAKFCNNQEEPLLEPLNGSHPQE